MVLAAGTAVYLTLAPAAPPQRGTTLALGAVAPIPPTAKPTDGRPVPPAAAKQVTPPPAAKQVTSPPAAKPAPPPAAAQPVTPPPAAQQVTPSSAAAAPGVEAAGPRFDIVRVAPDGAAVIAGRATPGASVTVQDGDQPLGSVTADRRGEWVFLPDQPLGPGTRELNLTEHKPGSDEATPSERVVVLMVPEPAASAPASAPTSAPAAVTVAETFAGGSSAAGAAAPLAGPLAIEVSRTGIGASTVLQVPTVPKDPSAATRDPAAPPPPGGVSVESVDYDAKGQVALGGRAQPGSAVQLYLDNLLVGWAHTDPEGRWRLSPERAVTPGLYTLRADQVTEAGKVTARVELPVQVSQVPASLPEGRSVVVQPGNSLWRIARSTYGQGVRYTQIYEANRSQIRDPDLIYPGQIFALPVSN